MPLLEREHALASLAEYLDAARSGDGRLVFVAGEAGVGKSSLVQEFERLGAPARWAHGACDGLFTPRPLGPLFDIARELGGDLLEAMQRDAHRDELFRLLLDGLAEQPVPTVLCVEDIHWADESTLDLINLLGRRIRHFRTLVLLTYRDDELPADHPLRLVIGDLARQRATRRIDLAPLSRQAVRTLASDTDVDAAQLFELTGGNPFFVTELLHAGIAGVTASARAAVLARTSRLSASARRVVEAAALLGQHVDPVLLAEVVPLDPDDLDQLIDAGVLVGAGAELRFRHEITRLSTEEQVPAHRRRPLHAAALAALVRAECSDEARLAHHAEGALDAAAVQRYAPGAAARASALGAHREAAAQYERALRFAQDLDPRARATLHDDLARESRLIDAWDRAAVVGADALALWRSVGDRLREGAALAELSVTMWRKGEGAESARYAEQAVEMLEPHGASAELARAYGVLAMTHMHDGGAEAGIVQARRAREIAVALNLPQVISDSLNTEACLVSSIHGDWEALMQESLDLALRERLQDQAGRGYTNMQTLYVNERRFADAEKYFVEGSAYCEEHDIGTYGFCLRGGQAEALLHQGRWAEALELCEPLLAGDFVSPANRLGLALTAGLIAARRADPGAFRHLDAALAIALRSGDADAILATHPGHAEAHWLAGDLAAAVADLQVGLAHCEGVDPWYLGPLFTWCRRLGVQLPDDRDAVPEPYASVLAGRHADAVAEWDRLGCPYEAALASYDLGTEAGLREALRRFDALGANAAVQATRREMRRRGVRSVPVGARSATRAHPVGLTPREAEVLDLLCAGHTNADIAQRLVLSQRTVDHHVSAVLAKLGVPTRAQAAAEATRLGLIAAAPT